MLGFELAVPEPVVGLELAAAPLLAPDVSGRRTGASAAGLTETGEFDVAPPGAGEPPLAPPLDGASGVTGAEATDDCEVPVAFVAVAVKV